MFAFLPRLYKKFFPHNAKCESSRPQARYTKLSLERLEEREVPATATYIGGVGGPWDAPASWDTGSVPGSMDVAVIPAGKYCVLNSTSPQTVAGLTVAGQFDVGSKLSVTTMNAPNGSVFNLLAGGEVDVLASGDLGGGGTISGHIDSQGSSVTFDPGSSMVLATGANLTGSLFNVFGAVTVTGNLTESAINMVLDSNGGSMIGSLTGPGSVTVGGEFDWNGGSIGLTGSSGLYCGANADLKLQGANTKTLSAGILTDQCNGSDLGGTGGLIIMPGATFDNIGNPSCNVTIPMISTMGNGKFVNDADGFFDENGDTVLSGNFSNIGTLVLTAGSLGAHFDTTPDNMTVAYGPTGVTATEN